MMILTSTGEKASHEIGTKNISCGCSQFRIGVGRRLRHLPEKQRRHLQDFETRFRHSQRYQRG